MSAVNRALGLRSRSWAATVNTLDSCWLVRALEGFGFFRFLPNPQTCTCNRFSETLNECVNCVCVCGDGTSSRPVSAGIGSSIEDRWMDTIQHSMCVCTHSPKHTHTHHCTQGWMFPLTSSEFHSHLHCGGPAFPGPSPFWWPTCGTPRGPGPSLPHPAGPSPGARWKTPHYQSGSDLTGEKKKGKKRIVSYECPPTSSKGMLIPLEPVNTACTIIWKEERLGATDAVRPLKTFTEIYWVKPTI